MMANAAYRDSSESMIRPGGTKRPRPPTLDAQIHQAANGLYQADPALYRKLVVWIPRRSKGDVLQRNPVPARHGTTRKRYSALLSRLSCTISSGANTSA